MYHTMIVDDEPLMRTYLSKSIPLFSDLFDVSAVAKDGLDAIELLKTAPVDLVITDIKMPEADGLTLAKYIHENYPSITVIIISGFSDFEYAQKAIRYNVKDYLLKPLVNQTLVDLLENVAARLQQGQKISRFQKVGQTVKQMPLRCRLLTALLDEDTPQIYPLYEELHQNGQPFMKQFGCIMECKCHYSCGTIQSATDVDAAALSLNLYANELCTRFGWIALCDMDGSTYILADAEHEAALEYQIGRFEAALQEKCLANLPVPVDSYCGRFVTDMMQLSLSYDSLAEVLPLAFVQAESPFCYCDLPKYHSKLKRLNQWRDQLTHDFHEEEAEHWFTDLKNWCTESDVPKDAIFLWRSAVYLTAAISTLSPIEPDDRKQAFTSLAGRCREHIGEFELEELVETLLAMLHLFSHRLPQSAEISPVIQQAKEYIMCHYQENISLSDVAEHCAVSSSYLSDLFHKQLGVSYLKYITGLRMERAAKLLKNQPDLKIYEVAAQTGFVSDKHFISVFKKFYGVSPTVYQKKNNIPDH